MEQKRGTHETGGLLGHSRLYQAIVGLLMAGGEAADTAAVSRWLRAGRRRAALVWRRSRAVRVFTREAPSPPVWGRFHGRGLGRETSRSLAGLAASSRRFGHWLRSGWLYRWVTADPDPEVIVIDLRETWTVGPFLSGLEWAFAHAERGLRRSFVGRWLHRGGQAIAAAPLRVAGTLLLAVAALVVPLAIITQDPSRGVGLLAVVCLGGGLAGLRDDRSWAELRDTRPVRLLSAVFEPPPPETATAPSEDND